MKVVDKSKVCVRWTCVVLVTATLMLMVPASFAKATAVPYMDPETPRAKTDSEVAECEEKERVVILNDTKTIVIDNKSLIEADNDGSVRENPYGTSPVKPSFVGEYYDCYIPYSLTCEEVGGYAYRMGYNDRSRLVGTKINWEGDLVISSKARGTYTKEYDENTGATMYVGADGTKFYVAALPYFCYNNEQVGSNGFAGWGMDNRGQVYDVILTDGTVLHFVIGDAKATAHTNGGSNSSYSLSGINYPQYTHLFQAYAGETIEIFGKSGCTPRFMKYYNLGNGEDQNKVAYIRMYNLRLRDGEIIREEDIPAGVSYSNEGSTYTIEVPREEDPNKASRIVEKAMRQLMPDLSDTQISDVIRSVMENVISIH